MSLELLLCPKNWCFLPTNLPSSLLFSNFRGLSGLKILETEKNSKELKEKKQLPENELDREGKECGDEAVIGVCPGDNELVSLPESQSSSPGIFGCCCGVGPMPPPFPAAICPIVPNLAFRWASHCWDDKKGIWLGWPGCWICCSANSLANCNGSRPVRAAKFWTICCGLNSPNGFDKCAERAICC